MSTYVVNTPQDDSTPHGDVWSIGLHTSGALIMYDSRGNIKYGYAAGQWSYVEASES